MTRTLSYINFRTVRVCHCLLALLLACESAVLVAQQPTEKPAENSSPASKLGIDEFTPLPKAKLKTTDLTRAKLPAVDVHTHFWVRLRHDADQLKGFVEVMDRNNIAVCVSLDGQLGQRLDDHIRYLWTEHRQRFVIFTNVDWQGSGATDKPETWDCNQPGFARRIAAELQAAKTKGVSGLKVFKSLGLEYRRPDGGLIEVDDSRFDPIWEACGQLGLPVLMHTADPSAFFDPITPQNERYEELSRRPEWHFPADRFPPRAALLAARNRLFARHPKTTFIAAHFGNDAEDLSETAAMLDANPNVVVDIASRISELGRQPYSAREFFLKYQDRILFGTDGPWPEKRLHSYWRFLETQDEYFPYSEKTIPPQGLWRIYGIFLPDELLQKIYSGNAARIIPGVAERLSKLAIEP